MSTPTAPISTLPVTPTPTAFNYVPPNSPPTLLAVPNTSCQVAADRLYSIEHVWVKSVTTEIVVLGITTTFVEILGEPYKMTFPNVGQVLTRDGGFGEILGYKVSADLITPVSGAVIQINTFLKGFSGTAVMEPLGVDPYNSGWMIAVQLSNPEELKSLLTPQDYVKRLGKS
jgi:glycine cleavage system H protein